MFIPRFDIKKLCFDPFSSKEGQKSRSRKIRSKVEVKVTRSTEIVRVYTAFRHKK